MACKWTGGDCMLALPTPCGACDSESESFCIHPVTGETIVPPTGEAE